MQRKPVIASTGTGSCPRQPFPAETPVFDASSTLCTSRTARTASLILLLLPGLVLLLAATGISLWAQDLPAGKKSQGELAPRPAAGSEQERQDFKAAYAKSGGRALEVAANAFAAQYPDSQLRQYLYSQAMRAFELENDPNDTLSMAQKVLALNPNHTVALVLTATVLADRLQAGDPDRARKAEEIRKTANHAIESVGTGFTVPAGASPEQGAVYRTTLQSMAYAALGIMELKTGNDAQAEKDLATAAVLAKVTPDPYVWYHLALAQDHRKKYAAALNSVQQALQLASSHPELQRLAELEFDRLTGLAGHGASKSGASGAEPPQ